MVMVLVVTIVFVEFNTAMVRMMVVMGMVIMVAG